MIIQTSCSECKAHKEIHVEEKDYIAWKKGAWIQAALPYLSSDDRELLISGVCGSCFDAMFGGEE